MWEEQLKECLAGGILRRQEPMKRHTTFQVGGPADYYAVPGTEEQLRRLTDLLRKEKIPYYILGNGSNLLVSDQGYRGVIVSTEELAGCEIRGTKVLAGAGIRMNRLAGEICRAGLTGFEFAAGIPGTLGGAVVMNAGAYGGEMAQILTKARVMTPEGETRELSREELGLSYRTSCIADRGYLVLSAELDLSVGEPAEIRARMEELARRRKEKQPLEYPSAGSTFKRPEGHFAGKLIMDCGLAGFRVGGACVSEKHCGFVVNDKNGTAEDVYRLCLEVQKRVRKAYGVNLTMEVKILGDFC
ncbi:MAG: UDP-N-acetylmuramate dehydrogenase [Lachnospiraceae bacterium]|nr:UDP-N-acetylmuramate dehydrogenase [Lachnospiraceae bacterium]